MKTLRISQGGQTNLYLNSDVGENNVSSSSVSDDGNENFQSNSLSLNSNDKAINENDLKKAVDKLNKFIEDDNVSVEYSVHPKFGDVMIKMVNRETGDVISESPPQKILDMVAKMCEMAGVIFDKKA